MASRFYVPPEQIRDNRFVILGPEARHASVVLRKKTGDTIDLFDGRDLSYQGRIESISSERVEGQILSEKKAAPAGRVELILCLALLKGARWDWLVEKACEVGVAKLIPLLTARTVVKPAKPEARDRWRRIALAASKQCGRTDVMDVTSPKSLNDALKDLPKSGLALIPWEKETELTIREALVSSPAAAGRGSIRAISAYDGPPTTTSGVTRSVAIFIGPEGGWETGEVELARRHGVLPVHLGPTLLRSETAGLVAATLVLAELGVYS